MGKDTNNYNKDYYTARGIPQPAAEEVTGREKDKLTEEDPNVPASSADEEPLTGPDQSPEIARKMGKR